VKTIVYVDALNLYYILKKYDAKWLDLGRLCSRMLTENEIVAIKYFTARVASRVGDLDIHIRQNTYLRALKTDPRIEIIFGHFLTNDVWMVRTVDAGKPVNTYQKVQVIKTEEKGSDVNIASHLLLDGFQRKYEMAVVLSNDSDLATPISMVKNELKSGIGLICPHDRPSKELKKHVHFLKSIKPETYKECQFADQIIDSLGRVISKPRAWRTNAQSG
jgi:hypothetical protein